MARVTHQKSAKQNGASGSTRGGQIAKQRNNKKQKVVVQSSAQGQNGPSSVVSKTKLAARGHIKDKPRAHPRQLSFHTEPPPGYTFIPAGNPQLTNALKEFAKKENHKIFSVSVSDVPAPFPSFANVNRPHLMPPAMNSLAKSTVLAFISLLLLSHRYAITMASA